MASGEKSRRREGESEKEPDNDLEPIRALEFFSGIGGLHYSLTSCGLKRGSAVLAAFDVNDITNKTYAHNFPRVKVVAKNVQTLQSSYIDSFGANMWLLSPPCQPYSRRGKGLDHEDPRAAGFVHLISTVLSEVREPPKYILMENVEGFESSESHRLLIESVTKLGYSFQEFILSPHNFGIPYKRDRFFFVARRVRSDPWKKTSASKRRIYHGSIPGNSQCVRVDYIDGTCEMGTAQSAELWSKLNAHCRPLVDFLESLDEGGRHRVPRSVLDKSRHVIDIVGTKSKHCCCFTKSYTSYTRGSGSVLVTASEGAKHPIPRDDVDFLERLKLRYFSPREIANLHGFPASFRFPKDVTEKQKYKALGNSLSVTVVRALIVYLLHVEEDDDSEGVGGSSATEKK